MFLKDVPEQSGQVLLVAGKKGSSTEALVYTLEKIDGQWRQAYRPIDASIGRKGFALPGEKREGDGKTPSGSYPLESAFGYAPAIDVKITYRQATTDDIWVDDATSSDYNSWVKKGETKARSFEEMRRPDGLYKYGIVIGYNRKPVVKGMGSAIFFHIWAGAGRPTAGCVALSEENIVVILRWLDASQNPWVVIAGEGSVD